MDQLWQVSIMHLLGERMLGCYEDILKQAVSRYGLSSFPLSEVSQTYSVSDTYANHLHISIAKDQSSSSIKATNAIRRIILQSQG